MLNSVALCLICIFCVIGVIYTIKYVTEEFKFYHRSASCIVIGVKNHQESIEGILRDVMKRHPKSEILVIDYGSEDNTKEIVKKMSLDYERIKLKE